MPFQEGFIFPPDEELNIQEVNVSLPTLKATAFHLYKYCENINHEFALCRREYDDPRACLQYGKQVTDCTLEFLRKVKKNCLNEVNANAKCLYSSSCTWDYYLCRKTQQALDECMLDKLNLKRAHFGEPVELHVIKTERPKPPPVIPDFPDAPRKPRHMVTNDPLPDPRFGDRDFPNMP